MFKFTNAKFIASVVPAVLVACAAAHLLVPEARAEGRVESVPAQSLALAKSDRLQPLVLAPECSSPGWPYYPQSCQFDLRTPAHQARTVRIIALR
jgi:hypothetical protein